MLIVLSVDEVGGTIKVENFYKTDDDMSRNNQSNKKYF